MAKSLNGLGTNTEYINTGHFNGKKYEIYIFMYMEILHYKSRQDDYV